MENGRGFTLPEILMAIGVGAALVMFAVPSWQHMHARLVLTSQIDQLLGEFQYARSEAITRGRRLIFCKSADQQHCAGKEGSWNDGWIIFVDKKYSYPVKRDPGDTILINHVRSGHITLLQANRRFFRVEPDGKSTNGTFKLCVSRLSIAPRALIISRIGRARISSKTASGHKLSCP